MLLAQYSTDSHREHVLIATHVIDLINFRSAVGAFYLPSVIA
jgi:hypothetical protein